MTISTASTLATAISNFMSRVSAALSSKVTKNSMTTFDNLYVRETMSPESNEVASYYYGSHTLSYNGSQQWDLSNRYLISSVNPVGMITVGGLNCTSIGEIDIDGDETDEGDIFYAAGSLNSYQNNDADPARFQGDLWTYSDSNKPFIKTCYSIQAIGSSSVTSSVLLSGTTLTAFSLSTSDMYLYDKTIRSISLKVS